MFSEALAQSKIPALDVAARYGELGEALRPLINPQMVSKYGIEVQSFIVENVSVPAEVEQAIDKRSSMAAVGNLNDYVKFQLAQGLGAQGAQGGGGGLAGVGAEMAVGMAMAQQMMNQPGGIMGGQATPGVAGPPAVPVAPAPASAPDLMTPSQVAEMLGVAESDVLTSLDSGDLKGKKIGTQWRVTKSAVDQFLHS